MWQRIGVAVVMVGALVLFALAALKDNWGLAAGPGLTALGMALLLVHHARRST